MVPVMYRAKVVNTNSDGSIQVVCPALYGTNVSGAIPAAVGALTPDRSATVWIALENDDHNKPIWLPFELVSPEIPIFADSAARDTAIPSPTFGQLCEQVASAGLYQYNGTTAGWTPPWNIGWGLIYQNTKSGDSTITSNIETTMCDLGVQIYKAMRTYEIRAQLTGQASVTTTRCLARIYNVTDNNRANIQDASYTIANLNNQRDAVYLFQPGSTDRSVQFQLTAQNASGAGNFVVSGTAPQLTRLSAIDVGPAGDPV